MRWLGVDCGVVVQDLDDRMIRDGSERDGGKEKQVGNRARAFGKKRVRWNEPRE